MESKIWGFNSCDLTERMTESPINPQPRGIEPTTWSTQPLPPPSPPASSTAWSSSSSPPVSMEAILARIARLEARLEAKERRWASAFPPSRAETDPSFGLPDWCLPSWDPGSHQATTPATTTLATSLPAVQHQPLPAYYGAASPPFGFCHPSPQSRQSSLPQQAPWDSPWLRTKHEPPLPQKAPWDSPWLRSSHELSHSNYGGGYTGSSYANEPTPYVSPPPPPRDGYYVLDPLSHTQPQPPWDSPGSLTTPDDSQLSTTAERETAAERERGRGVTEMADEEGGFSMAENKEESLCAAARHGKLETVNPLIAARANVTGVNGEDLIVCGKGSSEGEVEEEESFCCVLTSAAAMMGIVIIGHHCHKKRKRYAVEREVSALGESRPMFDAEEVILNVFGLYALAEVYKDLHLEDKVILEGGGVDTLII